MSDAQSQSKNTESGLKKKAMKKVFDLAQTRNWYLDRYERVVVQRNLLFVVTLVVMVFMGLSVLAVSKLNERKVFEPFVIQVEDKSGIVTQVTNHNYERYTTDETVIRYFINQYIQARESFHPVTSQHQYETVVRLLSSSKTYAGFSNYLASSNPDSPRRLGRELKRDVGIKSLTFLDAGKKKVQVRMVARDVQIAGRNAGNKVKENHFIITMTYDFIKTELSQKARAVNPLGFRVTNYIKEKEEVR